MLDVEKVREDFRKLLEDDWTKGPVSYQQNIYWVAHWNGITEAEVKVILTGPMKRITQEDDFRLLSDRELYHGA